MIDFLELIEQVTKRQSLNIQKMCKRKTKYKS